MLIRRIFARHQHVATVAALLLIICLLPWPRYAGADSIQEAYQLGSGDRLRIMVYGEPDLSGEFEVDGSGVVSMPLIGEITARGLSLRQLEVGVRAALADGYLMDPRVSLEVLNYRPFFILGEVKSPGKYAFISGITVLNAVAMAGGYSHRARQGRAEIVRGGDPDNVLKNAPENTIVMPGDIIRIPERFF